MITLVFSPKQHLRKDMQNSAVYLALINCRLNYHKQIFTTSCILTIIEGQDFSEVVYLLNMNPHNRFNILLWNGSYHFLPKYYHKQIFTTNCILTIIEGQEFYEVVYLLNMNLHMNLNMFNIILWNGSYYFLPNFFSMFSLRAGCEQTHKSMIFLSVDCNYIANIQPWPSMTL